MKRCLSVIALALCACSSTPPEQLHTLRPLTMSASTSPHDTTSAAPDSVTPLLVIAPVVLPAWADRPQWVVRRGAQQLKVLEQHRWAEPLGEELAEGLAARLARPGRGPAWTAVPEARRASWPGRQGLRLSLIVQNWDVTTTPQAAVHDDLLWSLQCLDGSPWLRQGRLTRSLPVNAPPTELFEALTQAHGQVLSALAEEVTEAASAAAPCVNRP